jgi:DNA-binding GntR family transcriptional regulator
MTQEEVQEVYAIMIPLEEIAMRAASGRIDDATHRSATSLLDRMDDVGSVADFAILNVDFHSVLCEASGMHILSSTLRRLRQLSALYVAAAAVDSASLKSDSAQEHRDLLAALERGDADAAVDVATRHITRTRDERFRALNG